MNNKEFIQAFSQRTALPASEAERIIKELGAAISSALVDGDILNLSGFGTLEVKKKLERISVNPKTGKRMLVPPKLAIAFKPSAVLKDKFK